MKNFPSQWIDVKLRNVYTNDTTIKKRKQNNNEITLYQSLSFSSLKDLQSIQFTNKYLSEIREPQIFYSL